MRIVIDTAKCTGSCECIKLCPQKAIRLVKGKASIDERLCDGDGICIPACPNGAIRLAEGPSE